LEASERGHITRVSSLVDTNMSVARDVGAPSRVRRRALVLLNDAAKSVAVKSAEAIDAVRNAGIDVLHARIPNRSSVVSAFQRHASDVDLVIAGGGDGTLNAVLQGLVGSKLPLGILPLGTANDLAKTLGIPADLKQACEVIAAGHTRKIDIGRVNDVYYFNEASIGMSVALCRRLTKEAKSRFGVLALLVRAVEVMAAMRRFRALITLASGETIARRTAQLTFGNGQNFGGFLATVEGAIDDRKLDVYSVEFERWTDYFDIVRALVRRGYDDLRSVYTLHGKFFEVKTGKRKHIEADGEIIASTPATFAVVPSAVEIFVPAPPAETREG
jgi:diacylglycerol kinase (ATP)